MATMTRGRIQDLLGAFARESPRYREALINDPKSVVEHQLNTSLGALTVKVLVETADTMYVVIPHLATQGPLTDADLEHVAGGKGDINASCTVTGASAGNTFTQTNT